LPKPRCWRGEQTRESASCGARSAARVGAIAIQRMVHRKASASSACAQSRASAGGAAFWHSAASRGDFGQAPLVARRAKRESAPAAARGVQRALVRLRFSVWCIERHRHRRLVRKGTQAKVGPLSGTRAASRGDLGPSPAAGEAGSFDYGPAAARGRQRALVRLRFSVWCIERHRRRRLVRKATQAKAGPLSGTRLQIGAIRGQSPAAGEAGSFDYGPAAARGRQRALVRLRFSVWCIERHRHRRLVRKGTQAKAGPLSGTRLRAGVIWGQTPLLARRAVAITAQPRRAGGSARWCDCDSAYGA